MSESKVHTYINELFQILGTDTEKMITCGKSFSSLSEEIVSYVASTIAAESRGYISSLYTSLSRVSMNDPFFIDPVHANMFYDAQLDNKISSEFGFDIEKFSLSKEGIEFKEINKPYTTVAVGMGIAALAGILLGVLSGVVDISDFAIIAGVVFAGAIGAGITYGKIIPDMNKKRFTEAVHRFLSDLEIEMHKWVNDIVVFYNREVDELKKKCEGLA